MKTEQLFKLMLLALMCSVLLWSQGGGGSITGIVLDPAAAVVPNAAVEATNTATGVSLKTNTSSAGTFLFPVLQVGTYKVTITAPGFAPTVLENVAVALNQTTSLRPTLAVGAVAQAVEVSAAAQLLQPDTSEMSTGVDNRTYRQLPIAISGNQRVPFAFMQLVPGVVVQGLNPISLGWNTTVNGSQQQTLSLQVDGATVKTTHVTGDVRQAGLPVEAIEEFTLVTNNYSAQHGTTGGGVASLTLRSGTNEFHGDLYEYLRNDKLDARGFFAPKRVLNRQHEYGVNLGGPVKIPGVYDGRNKTFLFGYWGGFKYRAGAGTDFATIPSTKQRQGDFTDLFDANGSLIPIYDPGTTRADVAGGFTRDQFPGNVIPPSKISDVAKAVAALLPPRTIDRPVNNRLRIGNVARDMWQFGLKGDHNFSDRNRISVFYGLQKNGPQNEVGPSFFDGTPLDDSRLEVRDTYLVRINHNYIFRPNLVNQFTAGFNRQNHVFSFKDLPDPTFTIPGLPPEGLIQFSLRSSCRVLCGTDIGFPRGWRYREVENATNASDFVSWTKGRHGIKIGAGYTWSSYNVGGGANQVATFSFLETSLPNSPNRAATGEDWASFLLGVGDSGSLAFPSVSAPRWRDFSTFVQDDIKVTSKLTLGIGLRYEILFPGYEAYDRAFSFDPSVTNPATGTLGAAVFAGSGQGRTGRRRLADTYYRNFLPRLGFAYQLDSKTVLRGGYGMVSVFSGYTNENVSSNYSAPWSTSFSTVSPDQGITPGLTFATGFPTNFPLPPFITPTYRVGGIGIRWLRRDDGRPGNLQNWSFGIQRELPGNLLVEAAYVGTAAHHLSSNTLDANQVHPKYLSLGAALTANLDSPTGQATGVPRPYAGFTGTVAQALRPYPYYQYIALDHQNLGNSNYNSFQLKAQRRFSQGLSVLASYTVSKSLTDAEQSLGIFSGSSQDTFNRKVEKGLSSTDLPNYLTLAYTYDLPVGKGKAVLNRGGAANKLLGGWGTSGILVYTSGFTQRVTIPNTLPLFNGYLRPNSVPNVDPRTSASCSSLDPATAVYLDAAAFSTPAPFTFGNAPRRLGNARNCPSYNENIAVFKNTGITESKNLEFRWEAFNVFNRVRFSRLNTNLANPAGYGRFGSQGNQPRIMQFALRLRF